MDCGDDERELSALSASGGRMALFMRRGACEDGSEVTLYMREGTKRRSKGIVMRTGQYRAMKIGDSCLIIRCATCI